MPIINQTEKDKELEQLVIEYASKDDIEPLHELLINWPENSLQWLIYVESRMMAPSTSKSDRERLGEVREKALLEPELIKACEDYVKQINAENEESIKKTKKQRKPFDLSEEEKQQYEILESLEEICHKIDYDLSEDEFDKFFTSIDLENQNPVIQHQAHKIIYNQLFAGNETNFLKEYSKTSIYQNWVNKFGINETLNRDISSLNILKDFCELEYQSELISRKGYYDYLLLQHEEDEEDYGDDYEDDDLEDSFEEFFEGYGRHYQFCKEVATQKEIQNFEQLSSVKLPSELQQFYETLGCFYGNVHLQTNIWSIDTMIKKASYEANEQGIGLADAITSYAGPECLNKEDILILNREYTAIGYVAINDDFNTMLIPYFDKNEKFDIVVFDIKSVDSSYNLFIKPILEKSCARLSFFKLLTAIILPLSTSYFGDHYEYEDDLWKDLLSK